MKAKHAILLIAFGFCMEYAVDLMRIAHWRSNGFLLLIATLLKVFGVLLLAYKVIAYEGFRKFMNR